ncbi:hypothetical protein DL96DRAFT_1686003 [Flagelloscypha sp. PMI_526]|nr:hypothetical protein DL96DRAFT_1686003 [Flagelloscypha sp. PMI_526]
MAMRPKTHYKNLVSWSRYATDGSIEGVSRELAVQYQSYALSQRYRPLDFDGFWLQEAIERCTRGIEIMQLQQVESRAFRSAPLEIRHRDAMIKDTHFVRDVLESMLQLPIQPFPPIPTDIILEILQCSAICHQKPYALALVSRQVQHCVDPIVFSTLSIGPSNRFLSELFQNSKTITSGTRFNDASPRLPRFRTSIRNVEIEVQVPSHALESLSSVFPNIQRLVINFPTEYPILLISVPTLKVLECSTSLFDPLNFRAPLFNHLTTLSLNTRDNYWPRRLWNWSTLRQTQLNYLWIIQAFGYGDTELETLDIIETQVIPNLPSQIQFCAFCLHILDDTYWEEIRNISNLLDFANGLWDLRTILVLAKEPPVPIPQAVIVPVKGGSGWDRYQDKALAVVRKRERE